MEPRKVKHLNIGSRRIGPGEPVYVVAELSANHRQDFNHAERLLRAAAESGADAVKLQTYTPESLTLRSDDPRFRMGGRTPWRGRRLFDLYEEAYMPWDWQPKLAAIAEDLGVALFSSPFDPTAVDFLEEMNAPAYKVASFELVDLPLIEKIAATGKPLIMSTGMASVAEIEEALAAARSDATGSVDAPPVALLKCTSAYPAKPESMNLRTIADMAERFGVVAGLSDHTLESSVAVAAVSLGACIVEKHFTMSRGDGGPDALFSLEPTEFADMVRAIRMTETALGRVQYECAEAESSAKVLRRSLFVVKDIAAGELFAAENVRSIRPAGGLPPKHLGEVLGLPASRDLKAGTPLGWDMLGDE